jgi:hypothetical protein
MDFLKTLPALAKQHWEKMVLAAALLILAAAGLLLAQQRGDEVQKIESYRKELQRRKPIPYALADWTHHHDALRKGTNPVTMDFTRPRLHYLFSPVKWLRNLDGQLVKVETGSEVGADALRVTKISPLYTMVTLERASGSTGFQMGAVREASTNPAERRRRVSYVSVGAKDSSSTFLLKEAKGTNDDAELTIEMLDTNEKGAVLKDKPFRRVDGYTVDFTYPPEKKNYTAKRLNETINVGGEDYKIIAITQNEVVISANSNNKRTTLPYRAAP